MRKLSKSEERDHKIFEKIYKAYATKGCPYCHKFKSLSGRTRYSCHYLTDQQDQFHLSYNQTSLLKCSIDDYSHCFLVLGHSNKEVR